MSTTLPIFTKAELQSFPSLYKQQIMAAKVKSITEMVTRVAKTGNTEFMYAITDAFIEVQREMSPYDYIPSIVETLQVIQRVYPDSKVIHIKGEGILIDWS